MAAVANYAFVLALAGVLRSKVTTWHTTGNVFICWRGEGCCPAALGSAQVIKKDDDRHAILRKK
jgi:hypothetical protein